jgi:hypothetical protein
MVFTFILDLKDDQYKNTFQKFLLVDQMVIICFRRRKIPVRTTERFLFNSSELGCPRKCFLYFRRNVEFDQYTEFRELRGIVTE